jgi:hypothetical protein
MLERLLDYDAGIGWFTTDEAYGDNPGLRAWCEQVRAVRSDLRSICTDGVGTHRVGDYPAGFGYSVRTRPVSSDLWAKAAASAPRCGGAAQR